MSERITQELRDATTAGVRLSAFNGNVLEETLSVLRTDFESRCDAIDAVHNGLERENDRLKCELDRVLGELDDVHKTEEISDNTGGFMHDEKRSIGSAVVTITDELRKWAEDNTLQDTVLTTYPPQYAVHGVLETLLNIADRIDAEHHRQLDVLYRDMSDAEWVRLPLDADGVPIHIGDVMDWVRYGDDDKTIVREVSGVGVEAFFAWSDEQGRYAQYEAHAYRHHHADSWERIINDAVNVHGNGFNPSWTDDRDALVARCKALAGDAE